MFLKTIEGILNKDEIILDDEIIRLPHKNIYLF